MRWILAVTLAACHHAAHEPAPAPVVIEVSASLPGASSQVVASTVATPLERVLAQLPHVASLTSTSKTGTTVLRLRFDGEDKLAAEEAVRRALNATAPLLPRTLPAPPMYTTASGPLVGRYVVASDKAERTTLDVAQMAGVGLVETCGDRPSEEQIDVDPQRLTGFGLVITDVLAAVRAANIGATPPATAVGTSEAAWNGLVVANRNGAPIRLGDIADVHERLAPASCIFMAATPGVVELVIHAQPLTDVDPLRAAIAKLGLVETPHRRELHVDLASTMPLDQAATSIATALEKIPTESFEIEVREGDARVFTTNADVLGALRRAEIVIGAGEPTATIHVSGADPAAVASTAGLIDARLRHAGLLVGTHGLAVQKATTYDIDRDAASRLGISPADVEATLADARGVVANLVSTQTSQYRVMLRATRGDGLVVRAAGGALVPLDRVVRTIVTTEPVEVLHDGQFPDVDLEVNGDANAAIGTVPAGVRVAVEPASRGD